MTDMVSIIVPVYNAERTIAETIESVLRQTVSNFELILVNDCSKDNSTVIIKGFSDPRIRLLEQPENRGAAAARNRGIEEAKGRYIAFIDSDDLWDEQKLEHELAFMKEKDAGFVFAGYRFADENAKPTGAIVRVKEQMHLRDALKNTTIFTSTVLIDRSKIEDDLIRMPDIKSEDTATWWRILMAGHTAYGLNEVLVTYRRSAGTLSSNKLYAIKRIWNLYRKIAGLSVIKSCYYFCFWAVTAVLRRL